MKKTILLFLLFGFGQGYCQDTLKLIKTPRFSVGYDFYNLVLINNSKIVVEYFLPQNMAIVGQVTLNDQLNNSIGIKNFKNYSVYIGYKIYFSDNPYSGFNVTTNLGYRNINALTSSGVNRELLLSFKTLNMIVGYNKVWKNISLNPYLLIGKNFLDVDKNVTFSINGVTQNSGPIEVFFGTTINYRF